jgi:hypothetical protein
VTGSHDDDPAAAYRWHQIVWRLDELDRLSADGVPVDEVASFDAERAALSAEAARIEGILGPEASARLRRSHTADRAYRRQLEEMDGEEPGGGGFS